MKTDFVNQPLEVGDYVAFTRPHYRELCLARVIAFTPQKMRVRYRRIGVRALFDTHLLYSGDVVKITSEDALAKFLLGENTIPLEEEDI